MDNNNNVDLLLPDWATEDQANLYAFPDTSTASRITNRLRRVESIVPYRRRGVVVKSSSSSRPVQASAISSAGTIDTTSVQTDATISTRRSYDSRTTTREQSVF